MSELNLESPELRPAITYDDNVDKTSSTCSSQGSGNIENDSNPSFNGHTIKETTNLDHAKLVQAYLAAKAKYDKALETLNHAKGLNWLGKAVWSSLAQIGIGKSLSAKHCKQELEKAFDDYEEAGVALTQHKNFSRYLDSQGFVDHEALNNKISYNWEAQQSIGPYKFPSYLFEAGAILLKEVDKNDRENLNRTNNKSPFEALESDTKNGTWTINKSENGQLLSVIYDDRNPELLRAKSASIQEVQEAIRELAGPNTQAQETAAYFLHPINATMVIQELQTGAVETGTKIPPALSKLTIDSNTASLVRTLLPGEYDLNRPEESAQNKKTLNPSYTQITLQKGLNSERVTIQATKQHNNRYLVKCNASGNALKEGEDANLFTSQESNIIKRTIDLTGTVHCTQMEAKSKFIDQSSAPINEDDGDIQNI